jgi:predicted transglutaminase-like cysteine proteinase
MSFKDPKNREAGHLIPVRSANFLASGLSSGVKFLRTIRTTCGKISNARFLRALAFGQRRARGRDLVLHRLFRHGLSIVAQVARTLSLIAAIGCGAASAGDTDQSTAVTSKSQLDNHGLARLAVLTPGGKDHGQARTTVLAEPFGLQIMAAPPNEVSAKWGELQSRIRSDEETFAMCRSGEGDCPVAARGFLQIIEQGRKRQGRARIAEINRAVNLSIKPLSDWVQHGVDDVWSAPLATFATGAGDCEDYAIAKYVALRESGTVSDDLRLVIVRDIKRNTEHAVVAVRFDGAWLVLDNRHLVLVNAEEARHYYPLFVMDHRSVSEFSTAGFLR